MKLRTNNIARSLWNWHDLDDKQKSELKGALTMNDYQLAQQHSVKRIDK